MPLGQVSEILKLEAVEVLPIVLRLLLLIGGKATEIPLVLTVQVEALTVNVALLSMMGLEPAMLVLPSRI